MRLHVPLIVLLFLLAVVLAPVAHAEIYKCTDENGNVSYQQTPCPAQKPEEPQATDDEASQPVEPLQDEYVPESTPEPQASEAQVRSSRQPGESLDDCKKRYRDRIDEIDADIRTTFSPEQGGAYKEELLALTKQLRACDTEGSDTG